MHGSAFIADLAIVLSVAAVTGVVARWLRQPTVLAYLIAGLVVGPYLPIPVSADPVRVQSLAEFGVVLVMFAIGLEFRVGRLMQVLPVSGFTGLIQVSFMAWCGVTLGHLFGWTQIESVFLGSAIAISSTMVVTRVFEQKRVADDVRAHVIGVLVLQDVAAVALITLLPGVAVGEQLEATELALELARLLGALAGMLIAGVLFVPPFVRLAVRLRNSEILTVVSVGLCFGIALLAQRVGYSVGLGAFLAGVLVAESGGGRRVEHLVQPLRDVFASVFFVSIGMSVDPGQAIRYLPHALAVAAVVVVGQLASVSIAGFLSGNALRRSIVAGLALGQIGEFGFIMAGIGTAAGAIGPGLNAVIVTVAVLTTFTTPLLLGRAERIVHAADQAMPHRLLRLIDLYESWIERLQAGTGGTWARVRRAVRALAFDAAGLILVLGAGVALLPRAASWIENGLGLSFGYGLAVLVAIASVAAAPLALGLARNTRSLAELVSASVASPEALAVDPGARVVARTAQLTVWLVVALGAGAPAIAVLRPLLGAPYGAVFLLLVVIGIGLLLWRSAGKVEHEFRSGAEEMAMLLMTRSQSLPDEEPVSALPVVPGLDFVVGLRIEPGVHALGRTLAEIDLRARTGATVVAIRRGGSSVPLPTGDEQLDVGDVLALTGTKDAVSRARKLLEHGPGDSDERPYAYPRRRAQ